MKILISFFCMVLILGLIELLYKKTLNIFKININDPFNVSKIDEEFKDNPSILFDNINTIKYFFKKDIFY